MICIKNTAAIALLLCLSANTEAQHIAIKPDLPFDLALAAEKNYSKASVQFVQYERGEEDESGYTWSLPHGEGYQHARYSFFGGKMEFETRYLPNGDKAVSWEYTYREDLLSVIDEINYDTAQKPITMYSHVYHYDKNNNPFQKVTHFNKERNFRLLFDYSFDTLRRPIRERITASGLITKWDNIQSLAPGRQEQMTLVEYRSDMKMVRIYENMHRMIESYQTIYDKVDSLPQRTEMLNAARKTMFIIDHDYEEGKLLKETRYLVGDEPEPVLESATYYFYDSDGLLERRMIEKGNLQTIYSYSYFVE